MRKVHTLYFPSFEYALKALIRRRECADGFQSPLNANACSNLRYITRPKNARSCRYRTHAYDHFYFRWIHILAATVTLLRHIKIVCLEMPQSRISTNQCTHRWSKKEYQHILSFKKWEFNPRSIALISTPISPSIPWENQTFSTTSLAKLSHFISHLE